MIERVVAIDYGRKRIGLAGCDALGITVQPLDTLHGEPLSSIDKIAAICRDRDAQRIVIGLPLTMDDSEGKRAAEVRRFGARVGEATKLPVEYSDERLTSWSAEQDLAGFSKKIRRNKGLVDAMAAVAILRDWLASRGPQ